MPVAALVRRCNQYDPNDRITESTVRRWCEGSQPKQHGWRLGEALRQPPAVNGWSGLLSLFLFGLWKDFVGVLGSCNPDALRSHSELLVQMLLLADNATYVSPYDIIPFDHEVLNGGADEFRLRQIADQQTFEGISAHLNFGQEAAV
jgi:hypothetical protein